MSHADAMKRLRGCRELQPDAMQVIVAAEIVDALLDQGPLVCVYCGEEHGHSPRCSVTKFGATEHKGPAR